jgi:hypothetical protein
MEGYTMFQNTSAEIPGQICIDQSLILKFRLAPVFLGEKNED